jgi:hypothetical protein
MSKEFRKEPLTLKEKEIVDELVILAGGMGCMKERALLNDEQRVAIEDLGRKRYVALTKKKFIVILPP